MRVTLDLMDRIMLKTLLAGFKGHYPELVLAQNTANAVLSDDLVDRFNITIGRQGPRYAVKDEAGNEFEPIVELEIKGEIKGMITRDLRLLEEAGALTQGFRHLYELFVLNGKRDKRK